MTCAIVKVLPEPVTPRRTWSVSPLLAASTRSAMAVGWSPAGVIVVARRKGMPPSDFVGTRRAVGLPGGVAFDLLAAVEDDVLEGAHGGGDADGLGAGEVLAGEGDLFAGGGAGGFDFGRWRRSRRRSQAAPRICAMTAGSLAAAREMSRAVRRSPRACRRGRGRSRPGRARRSRRSRDARRRWPWILAL